MSKKKKPLVIKERDFIHSCIGTAIGDALSFFSSGLPPRKYSEVVEYVADEVNLKFAVKSASLATNNFSKATTGSIFFSDGTAAGLMIWKSNSATVTVLMRDGNFKTRAWIFPDEPIPRVIPIEDIYKCLVEK